MLYIKHFGSANTLQSYSLSDILAFILAILHDIFMLNLHILLFVFSMSGPKQNAGSLLDPVSDAFWYTLSHGSFDNGLF